MPPVNPLNSLKTPEFAIIQGHVGSRSAILSASGGKILDSGALRAIAVVTIVLLPPTFTHAIFSISFFDYTPAQGSEVGG
ncbi:hypothetical protein CC78DRAFT_588069 [Lojkania enalia]|uniref:Uncharacterized protein n=1 Tax=Lojkania enalia TaxID=147567 RepID=A0A9P4K1F3_9PLEO|nr:hypothetical protein CC78DRAFT_588069 [Didymosphaeria enalia]